MYTIDQFIIEPSGSEFLVYVRCNGGLHCLATLRTLEQAAKFVRAMCNAS